MALSDYGKSFSPVQKPEEGQAREGGNQTQDAIRTISTRIPRISQGGQSLAPSPLLNAPGGMGMAPTGTAAQPNVGGLEELLRRLMGLFGGGGRLPGGMAGGMAGGSAPLPHVTPGTQSPIPPGAPIPAPTPGATEIGPLPHWGNFNPGQQGGFPSGEINAPRMPETVGLEEILRRG